MGAGRLVGAASRCQHLVSRAPHRGHDACRRWRGRRAVLVAAVPGTGVVFSAQAPFRPGYAGASALPRIYVYLAVAVPIPAIRSLVEEPLALLAESGGCRVESGGYRSRFGYILVDEFQDISPGRARPLKALPDRSLTAGLFAVSDGWQAIYRFAGSDIAIMREFEERFGESARIDLETPLRCADRSATVATIFVLSDPAQLRENVSSTRRADADGPCVPIGPPSEECTDLPRDARAIRGCPCLRRKHPGTKRLRRSRDNRLTPRERTVGHRQLLAFGEA